MAKISKRVANFKSQIEIGKAYAFDAGMALLRENTVKKFVESIDVAVHLGVDPRKSDQTVRGAVVLPHGTGKVVRVAVFAQGPKAEEAKAAGADIVGFEDLAESIKSGSMPFETVIASPDCMALVGKLGQILGPRGLMPNPKTGTVTPDVAEAVRKAKAGQIRYRVDKNAIIHCAVGTVNHEDLQLQENIQALLSALKKGKPASAKGVYLQKITISSTMGPGIVLDFSGLL